MNNYEYVFVTKKEYRPVKIEIEEKILSKVHSILRREYGITFQHKLIGSGNKHLITKLKNGNKGFDFDYNLVLEKCGNYNVKQLKGIFISAFNKAISGTQYKHPEDSTSTITIKVVDTKNKKVVHSCDFAIIRYKSNDNNDGYEYIRNLKDGRYQWSYRDLSKNLNFKINEIINFYKSGWELIKEEYLKLKNRQNKHSFVLYLEAVNNVYNWLKQDKDKDKERKKNNYIYIN